MKCAFSQTLRLPVLRSPFSVLRSPFSVPSLGRSVTLARRLYVSSLANFRVSDPRHGAALRSALPPLRQGWRIWRAPRSHFKSLRG